MSETWGKGSRNNNIGYGQGSNNNTGWDRDWETLQKH